MRVTFSAKHFDRAFLHPIRVLAAWEATVVEEELEQGQVIWPQMAAEKEVVAQPTVEVLDHGAGTDRIFRQFAHRYADGKKAAAQSLPQHGIAGPS